MASSPPATAQMNNPGNENENPPLIQRIIRMVLIFFCMQFAMNHIFNSRNQNQSDHNNPISAVQNSNPSSSTSDSMSRASSPIPPTHRNPNRLSPSCIWPHDSYLDLHVYVTDHSTFQFPTECSRSYSTHHSSLSTETAHQGTLLAEWHEVGLSLQFTPKNHRQLNITFPLTRAVMYNETQVYAHVCLARQNIPKTVNSRHDSQNKEDFLIKSFLLTKHKIRKRKRNEKLLLGGGNDTTSTTLPLDTSSRMDSMSASDSDPTIRLPQENRYIGNHLESPLYVASKNESHDQMLLYMKPTLRLQLVDLVSIRSFPNRQSIPTQISRFMDWYAEDNTNTTDLHSSSTLSLSSSHIYYPMLYQSDFWITKNMLSEINGTMDHVTVEFSVDTVRMWKWQLMSNMEMSWKQSETTMNGDDDVGSDMIRKMLLETNPILLIITAIVSILHTVFDILAFKNDISFFKKNTSMEGLSLRSMVVNAGFQLVILLYLADNDTNYMVLISNGLGFLIELWKISKAVKITFDAKDGLQWNWKEATNYSKSKTREYDEIATSHLLFITMPLVAGYGLYSLLHQRHKSWYSWILNTLVGFIYMFGFVMMTPQLFINYKLQSVAHLNWRTMTYKSINTFIDDLFAFVIKMPIMHRLACLRDDVIFLLFCYQRYKYRTDYTRVNEFGQCSQPTEDMIAMVAAAEANAAQDIAVTNNVTNQTEAGEKSLRRRRGAKDK